MPFSPTCSSVISPLGQGDDAHASEAEDAEQDRDIRLIAADAIQRFGDDHIEAATLRRLQQSLNAGPLDDAGAGDGGVLVGTGYDHALTLSLLPADAKLVLDRGRCSGMSPE